MSKQRIIIIVAIIAVCAFGGYLLYMNPESEQGIGGGSEESVYTNDTYKFSIELPEGFRASVLPGSDDGSQTILVQGEKDQVQIYIALFDQDIGLTPERVQADIPDMAMEDAGYREVRIPEGATIDALTFDSVDESFGPTYNAWFIYGGSIYQLTSRADAGDVIDDILESWKFL